MSNHVGLVVKRPGFPDRRLPLQSGQFCLGRAEDNDICLPDIGVSRRHARIVVDGGGVIFEDLGSGNGSWFQGRRLATQRMAHGDEVSIEPFTLQFELQQESTHGGAGADATQLVGDVSVLTDEPAGAHLELVSPVRGMKSAYVIPASGLTLGRSEQRDVVVPDPGASRLHAEVVKVGGEYWVRDPGAANGLFVNEQRIREHRLEAGDVIRIGSTQLRFAPLGLDGGRRTDIVREPEPENTESFSGVLEQPTRQDADWQKYLPDAPAPPPAQPSAAPPAFGSAPPPPSAQSPAPLPPAGAAPAFGAPPPAGGPAFGGPAPVGPAFGGGDLGGKPPPSAGGGFFTPIRIAIGAIAGLVVVMIGVKGVMNLVDGRSVPGLGTETSGSYEAASELDAASVAEVEELMAEGMELFMGKRYYEATSRFLKVIKLDPDHEDAERMGYLACEFIAIQTLQERVNKDAASDAEKAETKAAALEAAEVALAGDGSLADAREEVRVALTLLPDDKELTEADTRLRKKTGAVARRNTERRIEKLSADVGTSYSSAKAALDRGDYANAIRGFEAVMAGDPGKSTEYYYKAEEGVGSAKSAMRRAAQEPYKQAMVSMKRGDNMTARSKLNETLRIDPYHSAASQKLKEVQSKLESEASDKFKEARVLESANQIERALSLYAQVQKLVGDKNHELHKKAQARIDVLLR
jgi:pSer/pThr/pTyr-binding forkhead associated (FHA) protein/tetratricopeptide (TPR) repeat protein